MKRKGNLGADRRFADAAFTSEYDDDILDMLHALLDRALDRGDRNGHFCYSLSSKPAPRKI